MLDLSTSDNTLFSLTYLFDSIYFELLLNTLNKKVSFEELRIFSSYLQRLYSLKDSSPLKECNNHDNSRNFFKTAKFESLFNVKEYLKLEPCRNYENQSASISLYLRNKRLRKVNFHPVLSR